eukprot:jgi/Hompol1/1473/HPOL_000349-RA
MSIIGRSTTAFAVRYTQPFINGAWVSTAQYAQYPQTQLICPATEKPIASVHVCGREHVDVAVAAARAALDSGPWGNTWTASQRRQALLHIADLIVANHAEFAWLESLAGKPIVQARDDIDASVEYLRFFAGFADRIAGKHFAANTNPANDSYTVREPIGVCGLIIPFNYPLMLMVSKVAPALAAGNTVVVKPADQTPLSALLFADMVSKASIPHGVVNVVTGGPDVGAAIVSHPNVDMISFTGSTSVGRIVAASCATLGPRPCSLELGGKSPIIICKDADLERAATSVVDAIFANMGQNCCAGSRLLVHSSVYETFVAMIKDRAERIVIGSPQDPTTEFGPVVDRKQFDRILGILATAKSDPAIKVITGGDRYGDTGFFIKPTILTGVDDASPLATDEIFGPVLSVLKPFDDIEDAVRRANNTAYGLAAAVWTNSLATAQFCTRKLRAGNVWVNTYNDTPVYLPFGGLKQSGYGKDLGDEAFDGYLLPVLTVNGTTQIAESSAILRYAGALGGLYPKDDALRCAHIDQVMCFAEELGPLMISLMMEKDEDKKAAIAKSLVEEKLPPKFAALDKILAKNGNGTWAVGDSISIADVFIYNLFGMIKGGVLNGLPTDIADGYTSIMASFNAVASHPRVVEWSAAHSKK